MVVLDEYRSLMEGFLVQEASSTLMIEYYTAYCAVQFASKLEFCRF